MRLSVTLAAGFAATPCCKQCTQPQNKYHSVDAKHGHCGETCLEDSKYSLYRIFEPNLTKSNSTTPCSDFGFPTYDSTETHGFGPVKDTLDLYDPATPTVTKEDSPCCKQCSSPQNKYHSVDAKNGHCGETCLQDSNFWLFKIFEPNLTKSDSDTPCSDLGFPTYDSTETHGFGKLSDTLDLYDPATPTVTKEDSPCCKQCSSPQNKYHSVDAKHGHCGETCLQDSNFWLFKIFEPNLTKSDSDTPCSDLGFPTYDSTETHGFGKLSDTLDLYDSVASAVVV